tara:strand:+ start:721 stop:927 length:207 start_codon:yes stop_codon:yes gene_type:complete
MMKTTENLTQSQLDLVAKISKRGQVNIRKLSNHELIDAIALNNLMVIDFKTTPRGNRSKRFIVIKKNH